MDYNLMVGLIFTFDPLSVQQGQILRINSLSRKHAFLPNFISEFYACHLFLCKTSRNAENVIQRSDGINITDLFTRCMAKNKEMALKFGSMMIASRFITYGYYRSVDNFNFCSLLFSESINVGF